VVCVGRTLTLATLRTCDVARLSRPSRADIDAEGSLCAACSGLGVAARGLSRLSRPTPSGPTEAYLVRRRGICRAKLWAKEWVPLTARASFLVRALADRFALNDSLIEVFPRATLELLGFRDPYKKRVDKRNRDPGAAA